MSDTDDPSAALDLAHLGQQTGGDPRLQRELLDLFVVQSAHLVARLEGLAKADPATARELAHRVNGSARAIGAFELAETAAELERSLAGNGAARLEPMAAALGRTLEAVAAHLSRLPLRRQS